ncbi:MAG: carboxypeptidase regulatory-like domain-containing protein [Limnochordaceae bacterium]|nr:carboxypeptidase regulatory-like domain-containing protein [Limnochordaceae bacterium]
MSILFVSRIRRRIMAPSSRRRLCLGAMATLLSVVVSGCFFGPATIEGQVVDATTGAPIPGAIVTAAGRTYTSEDGSFTLRGLPEGLIRVQAEAAGYQPGSRQVDARAGARVSVTIELQPLGPPAHDHPAPPPGGQQPPPPDTEPPPAQPVASLSLRVVDGVSGYQIPLSRYTVKVNGQTYQGSTGGLRIGGLPVGSVTLEVRSRYFQTRWVTVSLSPGANERTVTMDPIFPAGDVQLLARLVVAEAGGEPYDGQVAVAATVLHRVESPDYPDTLAGVIYDDSWAPQYEPVYNGYIWQVWPDSETWAAVVDALSGRDPSLGATGFFNPETVRQRDPYYESWVWTRPVTAKIGHHWFFI